MSLFGSDYFLDLVRDWEDPNPAPVVEKHKGIYVVRDDLLEGGSKVRFADKLIKDSTVKEFVYGGEWGWMINYVKHPWGPHTIETQIGQEFADILLEKGRK